MARRDEIIQIQEPNQHLFSEHDVYKEALYTPGLNIDREAAPVEAAIAENVRKQMEAAKPARWRV